MKKLFIGAAVGAALAYLFIKSQEDGGLDKLCDDVKDYSGKMKRNAKNAWDKGVNQAEYLKERAEDKIEMAQTKLKKRTVEE